MNSKGLVNPHIEKAGFAVSMVGQPVGQPVSFRKPESDYGISLFIAYTKSNLIQFLPDKGFLESLGHESFPKQVVDILRPDTSGKKILHPLTETAACTHQVVASQTEIIHAFQIELFIRQQVAEKRPVGVIFFDFCRQYETGMPAPSGL